MSTPPSLTGTLPVIVFGDGTLPEILLLCMQFRLAIDLVAEGRATDSHLTQLRGHLSRRRCEGCRQHLLGRLSERRSAIRRLREPE